MTPGERAGFLAAGFTEIRVRILERLLRTHFVWPTHGLGLFICPRSEPPCPDMRPTHISWKAAGEMVGLDERFPIPKSVGRAQKTLVRGHRRA